MYFNQLYFIQYLKAYNFISHTCAWKREETLLSSTTGVPEIIGSMVSQEYGTLLW